MMYGLSQFTEAGEEDGIVELVGPTVPEPDCDGSAFW